MNIAHSPSNGQKSLRERYLEFCEREEKQRALWFLVPLILLTTVVMPSTITLMFYSHFFIAFIAFCGICVLFFFTNIILSIAEQPMRVTISFFLFTVVFLFTVSLLSFLSSLFMGKSTFWFTVAFLFTVSLLYLLGRLLMGKSA